MIHVAVAGIDSDLGRAIVAQIERAPDMTYAGGTTALDHLGDDFGRARLTSVLDGAHVLVDVSTPSAIMLNALACVQAGCALVSGCGALDANHLAELHEYSRRIAVFHAPNLCLETAAMLSILPALRNSLSHLDIEVSSVDQYRRRSLADSTSTALHDPIIFLSGAGQEIILSQKVYGHEAPARGAERAVRFVAERQSGIFTMDDLLRQHAGPTPVNTGPAASARVS